MSITQEYYIEAAELAYIVSYKNYRNNIKVHTENKHDIICHYDKLYCYG